MSIPAFDAVMSSKVGIVQDDGRAIVCKLHDEDVEGMHGEIGDHWKRGCGYMVKNYPGLGIVPEVMMTNPPKDSLHSFSESFCEQMHEIVKYVRSDPDEGEEKEVDYTTVDGIEREIYQYIIALINQEELPDPIWYNIIEECHREFARDGPGLTEESSSFSESNFQDPNYLYDESYVEESQLGFIESELDSGIHANLWYQFKSTESEEWYEFPLTFETSGNIIAYDIDMDYGQSPEGLNTEFESALNSVISDEDYNSFELSRGERLICNALESVDLSGTGTLRVLKDEL